MSEPNVTGPEEDDDAGLEAGDDLQFDQAEYATPAPAGPSCGVCKRPIDDMYSEINGKICCATCRQQIETAFRGGSRVARVFKALIFGSVAAIAGAVLYYAIISISGWNIGLVAVLVGFMVGGAVRKGTGNRGGRFYQFLALFLAYMAIGLMHVPVATKELLKIGGEQAQKAKIVPEQIAKDRAKVVGEPKAPVTKDLAKRDGEPKTPAAKDRANVEGEPQAPVIVVKESARTKTGVPPSPPAAAVKNDPIPVPEQKAAVVKGQDQRAADAEEKPDENGPRPSLVLAMLVLIVFLIGLLFVLPVLAAISDPISGLIYSFALWEAWRINKEARLVFNGPFRVSRADSNGPVLEDVDDGE